MRPARSPTPVVETSPPRHRPDNMNGQCDNPLCPEDHPRCGARECVGGPSRVGTGHSNQPSFRNRYGSRSEGLYSGFLVHPRSCEPETQAPSFCNCLNPEQMLLRWQTCQQPQRMDAEPPSADGVAECQHHLLCFRGEEQEAEDLSAACPRQTQLSGRGSSGCGFTVAYSLVPLPG